ncbi:MAG: hypothetical protein CL878_12285, partial [Dehalococcoidia bacterium]|nr:hypothetical protein [Dehalococcoidia bacterium]
MSHAAEVRPQSLGRRGVPAAAPGASAFPTPLGRCVSADYSSWQQVFGRGLVHTTEDFGLRGSRPSHPALLDWLAVELIENGWDLKALHRLMVASATFKQSAIVSPQHLEFDPKNILLSRGPRFRLSAESIRDSALHAAGLLSEGIGGPSVYPPEPAG